METTDNAIIMLGTGYATATRCYNTCFILRTADAMLLVDAGGGNGILTQLERVGVDLSEIHDMFITHAHTDHILGAVWVVRMVASRMNAGMYSGSLTIYGHDKALKVLEWICRMTLPEKMSALLGRSIVLRELRDRDTFSVGNASFQCFDVHSTKEKQFGFRATLADGTRLACLGDEPCDDACRTLVENADWLMCEAFCLHRDRAEFKPYEKHHSTALDAGTLAEELHAKNLLLYHTEDKNLPTRKREYTAEASRNFSGSVFVPDDLESVCIGSKRS